MEQGPVRRIQGGDAVGSDAKIASQEAQIGGPTAHAGAPWSAPRGWTNSACGRHAPDTQPSPARDHGCRSRHVDRVRRRLEALAQTPSLRIRSLGDEQLNVSQAVARRPRAQLHLPKVACLRQVADSPSSHAEEFRNLDRPQESGRRMYPVGGGQWRNGRHGRQRPARFDRRRPSDEFWSR
jgi:hypothetical protein